MKKEKKPITREEMELFLKELREKGKIKRKKRRCKALERCICDEFDKNVPPISLEQFNFELLYAIDVCFMGDVECNGNTITLSVPNGQKFRVTTELIS